MKIVALAPSRRLSRPDKSNPVDGHSRFVVSKKGSTFSPMVFHPCDNSLVDDERYYNGGKRILEDLEKEEREMPDPSSKNNSFLAHLVGRRWEIILGIVPALPKRFH